MDDRIAGPDGSDSSAGLGLVERLRSGEHFYAESSQWFDHDLAKAVDEAADEIERLRAELAEKDRRIAALIDGNWKREAELRSYVR